MLFVGFSNLPASWFGQHRIQYLVLVIAVWRLTFGYVVFMLQSRTFDLFEYFGGEPRNGVFVLIVGMVWLRSVARCGRWHETRPTPGR